MPKSRRFFSAQNKRELLLPLLFIAPAVAVLLALSIYPLVYSVTISLQRETPAGIAWGLGNFARLVTDNFFWAAMAHTFVYAIAALACEFLLGLGLALLLNAQIRGRGFFRASLLVPMMLPAVVVGVVWRLMLNPNFGAIN
jgi:multiple sugar transport system permease protein